LPFEIEPKLNTETQGFPMVESFTQGGPAKLDSLVVQLGRIGDILNVIPPCLALGLHNILVMPQYRELLAGFSYMRPYLWSGDIENLTAAVVAAHQVADRVFVPQLFGLQQPPNMPARTRDSFVRDQWDRLQPGFGDSWGTRPLIVDTRGIHEVRCSEERAVRCCNYHSGRKMLVVALDGISGPYPNADELRYHLRRQWDEAFDIVDLYRPLPRFLDLLGLYGNDVQHVAAGLIAIDSAPLHLTRATPTLPVFQLLRDGPDGTPKFSRVCTTQSYACNEWNLLDEWLGALR
jgi:hypothetical protein